MTDYVAGADRAGRWVVTSARSGRPRPRWRRQLRALGLSADGWVPSSSYFPPGVLPGMHAKIDAGAADAGRDPGSVVRVYNVFGRVSTSGGGPPRLLAGAR